MDSLCFLKAYFEAVTNKAYNIFIPNKNTDGFRVRQASKMECFVLLKQ